MADSYDLILKGGTVVNQDGEGVRDIGIRRRPDRRDRRRRLIRRRGDRLPRPACAAGRDRQPGAFPRARPDPQGGPGNRLARRGAGRRHRGVRDAEHRADHHQRRGARRQGRARRITACIATSRSMSAPRARTPTSWRARAAARRLRRQGVHGLVDRLAADRGRRGRAQRAQGDPPPRRVSFRGRIPAARAHASARRGRSALASGVARRHRGADVHAASGRARARDRQARACAARHDQGGDGVPGRAQGRRHGRGDARRISRSPRPIATSGSARSPSSIRRCATPRIATASGAAWRRA